MLNKVLLILFFLSFCFLSCSRFQAKIPITDFEYEKLSGELRITKYLGESKEVVIPKTIKNMDVVAIGDYAFAEKQLTKISIPRTITHIGDHAFAKNQITKILLPRSIVHIGNSAFEENNLKGVATTFNLTHIGNKAFYNNQITDIIITHSVTHIGDEAFALNKLTKVILPKHLVVGNIKYSFDKDVEIVKR